MIFIDMTNKPVEHADRRLNWAGLINVRDLGGYVTRDGKVTRWKSLVRADNLNFLSDEGRSALRAYGVQTIVDLRYPKVSKAKRKELAAVRRALVRSG